MARGAAVAVGGGGHGSRRAWRASRGLPRLLWPSRVKEKGMGAGRGSGSSGSGRGARPDAAIAERGVRGGAGSQRGRRARSSGGDGAAQRGSGAAAAGAARQQRGVVRAAQ